MIFDGQVVIVTGGGEGLVRSLAAEGTEAGIRVNCVAPYVAAQMTERHLSPAHAARFSPGKVAPLVSWLASSKCSLSGEIFVVGGGAYRRAASGESETLCRDDVGNSALDALAPALAALGAPRHFPAASAAFSGVIEELDLK